MQAISSDVDSNEQYKLLIHSLTHEHTQVNGERHLLLMQKWIRDNEEGILIRDLMNVVEILKIVRGLLSTRSASFRPVVTSILNLCSKPLLESKANERLRVKGMADMKIFYKAIAIFCLDADDQLKSEVVHCFRCIINGGKDPLILRADVSLWKSKGGNRVQITDTSFIQTLIRECDIIEFVVVEFLDSVAALERNAMDFEKSSLLYTRSLGESQENGEDFPKHQGYGKGKGQTLRETLRDYGIHEIIDEERNEAAERRDLESSAEEKLTYSENHGANERKNNNHDNEKNIENENENENIFREESKSEKVKSAIALKKEKLEVLFKEQLTEDLFDLCRELSADLLNAEIMCSLKICDGVLRFLQYLVQDNFRDKRIPSTIDLLWTLLESFLSNNISDIEKSKILNENGENILENSSDLFDILDQEFAVQVLGNMITIFAHEGFKDPDKESRNEVLAVLTLLCESPSSHIYLIQSGLLNDLIYFACYAECSPIQGMFSAWFENHPQSSSNPRNFATSFELDLQFKRGLWILISELLEDNHLEAIECVSESPLLESLLLYLEFNTLGSHRLACTSSFGASALLLQSQYQSTGISTLGHKLGSKKEVEGRDLMLKSGGRFSTKSKDAGRKEGSERGREERNKNESNLLSSNGFQNISRNISGKEKENPQNFSQKTSYTSSQNFRNSKNIGDSIHGKLSSTRDLQNTYNSQSKHANNNNNKLHQMTSKSNHFSTGELINPYERKSFYESIPRVELLRLQVLGSTLLTEIGSKFEKQFLLLNGPERLYNILINYCESPDDDHINLISNLIVFLNRLLLCSYSIRNSLIELNIIQFCLLLFQNVDDDSTKSQTLRTIAVLCSDKNNNCQTQFREQDGIKYLIHAIKRCVGMKQPLVGLRAGVKLSSKYSMDQDDPLLLPLGGDISVLSVALLDCISQTVVGNAVNETTFALHDGLDILLEQLETSPCVLRLQILRVLSDLLENADMVPHVRMWRSPKTMRSAAQLATWCWLDEEVRLGGVRNDGVITNMMDPLGRHIWPSNSIEIPMNDSDSSSSNASAATHTDASKSIAISRLSAAILHSRFSNDIPMGNVPGNMRKLVLEKDMRGVIASVLQLLGAFDIQSDTDIMNISGTYSDVQLDEGINASQSMHTSSSLLHQDGQEGMFLHGFIPLDGEHSPEFHISASVVSSSSQPRKQVNSNSNLPGVGVGLLSPNNESIVSLRSSHGTNIEKLPSADRDMWDPSPAVSYNEKDKDDSDFDFSVAERQVIAIAMRYAILREGGWWREIYDSLRKEGIHPIESDLKMIKGHLEIYFTASTRVQNDQMNLQELNENELIKTEKHFISQISNRINEDRKIALSKQTTRAGRFRPITKK